MDIYFEEKFFFPIAPNNPSKTAAIFPTKTPHNPMRSQLANHIFEIEPIVTTIFVYYALSEAMSNLEKPIWTT